MGFLRPDSGAFNRTSVSAQAEDASTTSDSRMHRVQLVMEPSTTHSGERYAMIGESRAGSEVRTCRHLVTGAGRPSRLSTPRRVAGALRRGREAVEAAAELGLCEQRRQDPRE